MATERGKPNMGGSGNHGSNYGSGNFGQAASAVAEKGKEAVETGKGIVAEAAEKAKDFASAAAHKAGDAASFLGDKAGEAASFVGEKAEQATAGVGSGMKSLAGTIRGAVPASGMLHNAGEAVAGTLESGGRFLQEEGLKGMADDFTNLIRRNPVPAILVSLGLGYLIARATRS